MLPEVYNVSKINKPHAIEVTVPGSKSITNRALLLAALSDGECTLHGVLFSDDSRHFLASLLDLGFDVSIDEPNRTVKVKGCGGRVPKGHDKPAKINVGSAGTAARFLSAYLGMSEGRFFIDSSEQMKKRPMKELLIALESLGSNISYKEEIYHFPYEIGCDRLKAHEVTIDVDKSSQFLSALLIVSVLSDSDFIIHVEGSHGMAYVKMTVQMMREFGVYVDLPDAKTFVIPSGQHYNAMEYEIEPDLSAACYFYAASPLLHVPAKVRGVHKNCMQGDICFLGVLEDMGCTTEDEPDGIVVSPPKDGKMRGGSWDLSDFSDQALTLAAIAPFADSAVTIQNVGHIRMQECDRIDAICVNLSAMGIACKEEDGSITILPGTVRGASIETFEDHRVAMAFTIPGLAADGIAIINPSCCRKTFENYFDVLESAVY